MSNALRLLTLAAAIGLALSAASALADPPDNWDGLSRVQSRQFDAVYLAPDADFRTYTKVMIDPPEAAFRRNWQRDYNRDQRSPGNRITDNDAREALELIQSGFEDIFRDAYTAAGYQVVTTPAPDVLRLRTAVLNIQVTAPDQLRASRSYTFSGETGSATLLVEVRDSMSNALMGRAVDQHLMDDAIMMRRDRASNRADFRRMFTRWARMSVEGLARLRAASPAAAPTTSP